MFILNQNIVPPITHNDQNQARKVGFEIEYVGLSIPESANLLQQLFTGTIHIQHKYNYSIKDTTLGDFKVELDAQLLKKLAETSEKNVQENKFDLEGFIEENISSLFGNLIPVEIVTPPVYVEQISELDQIIENLRVKGAQDTHSSYLAAFGVHINPEAPSLTANSILTYLQSFCLLNDWLKSTINIDLTRQLSTYINDYPSGYVKKILSPNYNPSLPTLIDDYLAFNSTRNRGLDMLPLFAYIDEKKIQAHIQSNLIKPRPTFHYRLPNTSFSHKFWNFTEEWKRWLYVEKLAANSALRQNMSKDYLLLKEKLLPDNYKWLEYTNHYLSAL